MNKLELTDEESSFISFLIHQHLYGTPMEPTDAGGFWEANDAAEHVRVGQAISAKLNV